MAFRHPSIPYRGPPAPNTNNNNGRGPPSTMQSGFQRPSFHNVPPRQQPQQHVRGNTYNTPPVQSFREMSLRPRSNGRPTFPRPTNGPPPRPFGAQQQPRTNGPPTTFGPPRPGPPRTMMNGRPRLHSQNAVSPFNHGHQKYSNGTYAFFFFFLSVTQKGSLSHSNNFAMFSPSVVPVLRTSAWNAQHECFGGIFQPPRCETVFLRNAPSADAEIDSSSPSDGI